MVWCCHHFGGLLKPAPIAGVLVCACGVLVCIPGAAGVHCVGAGVHCGRCWCVSVGAGADLVALVALILAQVLALVA